VRRPDARNRPAQSAGHGTRQRRRRPPNGLVPLCIVVRRTRSSITDSSVGPAGGALPVGPRGGRWWWCRKLCCAGGSDKTRMLRLCVDMCGTYVRFLDPLAGRTMRTRRYPEGAGSRAEPLPEPPLKRPPARESHESGRGGCDM